MSLTYFKRYRMEAVPSVLAAGLRPLPPGYRFVAWPDGSDTGAVEALLDDHAEAKHESFRGELDSTVFECLSRRDGCRRLLGKIAAKPMFLPQATWLIEYTTGPTDEPHKREPCGTIQGTMVTPRMGAVHNVGVAPMHRGRGLGRALVAMAMDGFAQAGAAKVYLEVTAENTAAVDMYRKLGMRRTRTTYKGVDVAAQGNHRSGVQDLGALATDEPVIDTAFAGRR